MSRAESVGTRLEARVLRGAEAWAAVARWRDAWDALVVQRGVQSDLYDTATWLTAWCAGDASAAERFELLLVHEPAAPDAPGDEGALLAALPIERLAPARARVAGHGFRPRARVIVRGEEPDARAREALAALARGLAAEGLGELELFGLPTRDPATGLFAAALVEAGFELERQPGSAECLTHVEPGGFAAHKKRFKKFERTAKNFANKAKRLGELELELFGGEGRRPASAALPEYLALHAAGWKGALKAPMHAHRERLFELSDARGWARVVVARVAGVPAAALVCFRVGEALVAYSTVYDTRLAALSAGTVVMWRAHELLFEEEVPRVVDYLPGRGPQKDQLGVEHEGLLTLRARRGRSLAPLLTLGRRAVSRGLREVRRAIGSEGSSKSASGGAGEASAPLPPAARHVAPAPSAEGAPPVEELGADSTLELWLTLAAGAPSAARAKAAWGEGARWFAIGEGPNCVARVEAGEAGALLAELVRVPDLGTSQGEEGSQEPATTLREGDEAALAALAAALGAPLGVPEAPLVREAPLPWPGGKPGDRQAS